MRTRILAATTLALALTGLTGGTAFAHPANDHTLTFDLTCGQDVWHAAFNGGPSAFHLDDGQMFIWKQISYVTPDGQTGTIGRGIQGFAAAPTVTCTYEGAVSHNAYTVVGFFPPAG